MKTFFIAVLAILMTMPIVAQDATKDMKKAARSTGSYRLDPEANKDKLAEAIDLIDGAINAPELASSVKAWQTLGEVYTEVINGEVRLLALAQDTPIVHRDAPSKAVMGFTKAYTLGTKGFEKRDALKGLSGIINNISYLASIMLSAGDFEDSYTAYEALISGNDFLVSNGEPSVYEVEEDFQQQIYWAALAAYSGMNYEGAEKEFSRLYDADYDTPDIYSAMYDIRKKTGDIEGANAILEEGMKKYPEDKGLMFAEINDALARGDLEALVGKLKRAMETEPDNITIPTTLGNVYDQMYQKAIDAEDFESANSHYTNAKIYFAKALTIDENYFDAVYMMGAVEYNRAAQLAAELNLLAEDYTKEGTAKYDAKKEEMMNQFDSALPYFLKAETLNPADRNTIIALREIYARKDQLDKSNEYKDKLDALPTND
jgi:tetratricopeptide (TPR) repeat protein